MRSPPPSPAPGDATPAPSGAPTAAPSDGGTGGAVVEITLTASGIAFDTDSLEVPADTPFKIVFANNDAGIPHNVAIHEGSPDRARGLEGRDLQRGRDPDLRRAGPPGRDLRLRLHGPPQHDLAPSRRR